MVEARAPKVVAIQNIRFVDRNIWCIDECLLDLDWTAGDSLWVVVELFILEPHLVGKGKSLGLAYRSIPVPVKVAFVE